MGKSSPRSEWPAGREWVDGMYLMYVDESGDCGPQNSPTRFFVLSGLVIHELRWRDVHQELVAFRRRMRATYGLRMSEELHASHLMSKPRGLSRIPKHQRLLMIREFATFLGSFPDMDLINVVVDKDGKPAGYDVFGMAWRALLQRFENTMSRRSFRGPANPDERGVVYADHTDNRKLTALLRRMRRYNPVPHQAAFGAGYRNLTLRRVIEDPSFRNSADSYFVQAADVAAHLVYQWHAPSAYMRKRGGNAYYRRLSPIMCLAASSTDPMGVVRL